MSFMGVVTRSAKTLGMKAYKHRADIAFVGAAAAIVIGTVETAKGAVKNEEVKAKHTARMEEIKKEEEYKSPEEIKQAKHDICKETTTGYVSNYWLGVSLELFGFCLFGYSRKVRNENTKDWRDLALGTLASLEAIKTKMTQEEGADKAAYYFNGVSVKSEDEVDPETGEVTGEKKEVIFDNNPDLYSFLFYEPNIHWKKSRGANKAFLEGIQNSLNVTLRSKGVVMFHEIQTACGCDITELKECTCKAGVLYKNPDGTFNTIDFGFNDPDEATTRFREGLEPSVLIKVKNVVPNVYHYI